MFIYVYMLQETDITGDTINYVWVTNKQDSKIPCEEVSHGLKNIIRTAGLHNGPVVLYYDVADKDDILRVITTGGDVFPPNLKLVPALELWKGEIPGINNEEKKILCHIYNTLLKRGHCAYAKDILQLIIMNNNRGFVSDIGIVFDKFLFEKSKKNGELNKKFCVPKTIKDFGLGCVYSPDVITGKIEEKIEHKAKILKKMIALYERELFDEMNTEKQDVEYSRDDERRISMILKEKDPILKTIKYIELKNEIGEFFSCPHCLVMEGYSVFLVAELGRLLINSKLSWVVDTDHFHDSIIARNNTNCSINKDQTKKALNHRKTTTLQKALSESSIRKQEMVLCPRRRHSVGEDMRTKFLDLEKSKHKKRITACSFFRGDSCAIS